jgi:hypothetical protein
MKHWQIACVTALFAVLASSPAMSQGKCRGSCTASKATCMKNSNGNTALCNAGFRTCMANGTWTTQAFGSIHNQTAKTVSNICKR